MFIFSREISTETEHQKRKVSKRKRKEGHTCYADKKEGLSEKFHVRRNGKIFISFIIGNIEIDLIQPPIACYVCVYVCKSKIIRMFTLYQQF